MQRRALLAAISGGAAVLAGCAAAQPPGIDDNELDGGDDTDEEDDSNGEDNGSFDDVDGSVETTWTDCGDPDDETVFAVESGDDLILIGTTPAPNPCHVATLDTIDLENGSLSVTVGVKWDLEEDEDCIQCHGAIGYEIRIPDVVEPVDTIIVDHNEGGRHTIEPHASDEIPALIETAIETVDTGCKRSDDDEGIEVVFDGEAITIKGARPASDPCHQAILEEASVTDDRLSITVGVESVLEEGETCAQCIGVIEYEIIVDMKGADMITAITVEHSGAGTHAVEFEKATESG